MDFGKCGHEKCRCAVDAGDFCSDYCEDRASVAEVEVLNEPCRCGHPSCDAG